MPRQLTGRVRPAALAIVSAVTRDRFLGEHIDAVLPVARKLREKGYDIALAYWNRDDEPAAAVADAHDRALRGVAELGGDSYVSIKTPAFGSRQDILSALLDDAASLGVSLHLDSLGIDTAETTLAFATDTAPRADVTLGCTLPGRWPRSLDDAERLRDLDVPVRIVKGEWLDPSTPRADLTAGFLDIVAVLAGRAAPVRIATHDPSLARTCATRLRRAGTPCELEVLFGLPLRDALPRLASLGVPIRVYVPFGYGWAGYCVENVRARPSLVWRFVVDRIRGHYMEGFPSLAHTEALSSVGRPGRT